MGMMYSQLNWKPMKEITLAINKGDTWKYKLARWLVR